MFHKRSTDRQMLHRLPLLASLIVAIAAGLGAERAIQAAPEPAPVPTRWELDLRPGPLRVAVIDVEREVRMPDGSFQAVRSPRTYFYFTYTVINYSGEDLYFAPTFELATDHGEVLRGGRNVPGSVVRELLDRLRNPFLQDQISIIGPLAQGEENAREGLVVWPADDLQADELVVFAAGFSGETRRVARPDTGEEVLLRKVMMMRHHAPGNLKAFIDRPIDRLEERWILR